MPESNSSNGSMLLEVKELSKAFPGVRALDNVHFSLRRGEIHALMGENGAGKSTLIKVITGVYTKDSGEILLDGKPLKVRSTNEAAEEGISTVYQEVNLAPNLSVAENIFIGRQPLKGPFVDWKLMNEKAAEVLEQLDLTLDVTKQLSTYSIAIQQLISIARAIDISAKILILDEPTSSLDSLECEQLFKIMDQLKNKGMGIIFITHFLDQVYQVSDRISVLWNGQQVGNFETKNLKKIELISKMLGREITEEEMVSNQTHIPQQLQEKEKLCAIKALGKSGIIHPTDIDLKKGEILGVAGLLGSGRTELAKSIFGILPSPDGEFNIENKPVSLNTPGKAINNHFAFCPEDRKVEGIIPELTIRENIALPIMAKKGIFRRIPPKTLQKICSKYIDLLEIKTPSSEQLINRLSGGNQQKVILARWLAMEPKLLILDEPTRGIDIGAKYEIEKIMQKLRNSGMSILFISSELEEVVRNSDRVIVMRDRELVAEMIGTEINEKNIMHTIAGAEGEQV